MTRDEEYNMSKHNITHVKLCNGKLKTRSPYIKVAEKVDVMYWKTDNKGVLSIIMAAGEEGWEIYRDPVNEQNAIGQVTRNAFFFSHQKTPF